MEGDTEPRRVDLAGGRWRVVVLSGAGLSTESGIPDYRGPAGGAAAHADDVPGVHPGSPGPAAVLARSHLGWRLIAGAAPNAGHRAVASLQHAGLVDAVITQNVDGLHGAAGSTSVIELHGRLDEVTCLTAAT
ncbi:Sir2 family NAD-dependent protein deacetylase [Micromonospora sp. M12]